jgi:hypothetical protein
VKGINAKTPSEETLRRCAVALKTVSVKHFKAIAAMSLHRVTGAGNKFNLRSHFSRRIVLTL